MSEPPRPDTGPAMETGPVPVPPPPTPPGRPVWLAIVAFAAVFAVVVGIIAWSVGGDPTPPTVDATSPQALLARAPEAARDAGCGGIIDVGPFVSAEQDVIHVEPIDMPRLASWPSVPPASGPHANVTLPAGSYETPPPILPMIHSLEHGAVVVWYAPDADQAEVARIKQFYGRSDVGGHVIIAPYDYPNEGEAGQLPDDMTMAVVAWHHERLCEQVSLEAAFAFSADYATPTFQGRPYLGEAPEPGVGI
jgi:hypothetical protein